MYKFQIESANLMKSEVEAATLPFESHNTKCDTKHRIAPFKP